MWFIRAGLSHLGMPARTLQQFLEEYPQEEVRQISATHISRAKDAFGELIKELNQTQLCQMIASALEQRLAGSPLVVSCRMCMMRLS